MIAWMQLIHFYGVVLWVGGMFFAHFCLRPEVAAQLAPAQRLPLMHGVLGRFFGFVTIAVILIVFTGFFMFGASLKGDGFGFDYTPLYWRLMMGSGLIMAAIFAVIRLLFYPRLSAAVASGDWPAGGQAMDGIRRLVAFNLVLGVLTIAIAVLGAYGGLGGWGVH